VKEYSLMRTRLLLAGLAAASLTIAAACGTGSAGQSTGMSHSGAHARSSMPGMSGSMPGMSMPSGNGLSGSVSGYTLNVHRQPMAGMAMPLTFTITRGGEPVTVFDPEQTKLMHFYLIRNDLTGFQHLHPTMNDAGTWSVTPSALTAGKYRVYTQFLPHADPNGGALVTSRPITVAGKAASGAALPAPSGSTTVDDYTVAVTGRPNAGTETPLQISVSKNRKPVADLQPYLDTYAHVTAVHAGDLAFAHLHPAGATHGDHGGPTLTVHANLPVAGKYRMFIQFKTANHLHTAAITLSAS
jgi:hypothetical protein